MSEKRLFQSWPAMLLAGLLLASGARAGEPVAVTAEGATLQRLPGEYRFTEGPTADAAGNVWFTDQPNDRILRWDAADGTVTEWMAPAGRANGLFLTAEGALLAAADEHNQLWSIAPDRSVTVLVDQAGGRLLNGPNDIWTDARGHIWFTDPLYARDYWQRDPASQQAGQYVWLLRPVATDLEQPNGIIGTPDGNTLYVADIGAGRTYAFDIELDGSLTNKRLLCEMGSDGMTLDNEGNLYLTGQGVTVFDRNGNQIQHIEVPQEWTANVTFGGPRHDLLIITAGPAIYGIRMRVRGSRP